MALFQGSSLTPSEALHIGRTRLRRVSTDTIQGESSTAYDLIQALDQEFQILWIDPTRLLAEALDG